jgi:uncharacterized protein YndB with AHSA1/START domain
VGRQRKVSTSRVITADRQAIFDVIADPAMHPVIDGSGTVTSAREGGSDRLHLGARFGMDMRMGTSYRIENEVVEFEDGERVAWRHFNGHRWRYELEDVEGGTQVTETFDWSGAKARLPLELAGFPKRNLAAMRRTLERLDRLVTTGSADTSDESDAA